MRKFIFLTQEGITKTPNNVDIENLQLLGTAQGINPKAAFENFIKENEYLLQTDFDEIIARELLDDTQYYFSLKKE